jgi:hypothetical protein
MRLAKALWIVAGVLAGCAPDPRPALAPSPPTTASLSDCRDAFRHVAGLLVLQEVLKGLGDIPPERILEKAVDNYVVEEEATGELQSFEAGCVREPARYVECLRSSRTMAEAGVCE